MAIVLKLDDAQLQTIVDAINVLSDNVTKLSNNVAKWQGEQTTAIDHGFTDLIETFGGQRSEDAQARINELAGTVRTMRERLQQSVDAQTQKENE